MLAPNTYEGALKSETLRGLCYQIAAEVHLARIALQSVDDFERDTTLLSLNLQLHRWEEALEAVGGGHTFDRFRKLEEGMEAQS